MCKINYLAIRLHGKQLQAIKGTFGYSKVIHDKALKNGFGSIFLHLSIQH
jgi:hypothetical protein